MFPTERIYVKRRNTSEISEGSLNNVSFSSNNSFYEKLDLETKRDIIFLIKSGYNKRTIIKLYIYAKPSNLNEAVHFLTKENGIYQHIFYDSPNEEDSCEICGDKKINHIDQNQITFISNNISFVNSINITQKNAKINESENISKEEEIKYICKICEEEISEEEEINNKCEQCENYFCSECLYSHIKELIMDGKYSLYCPGCNCVYTKDKIEEILNFNIKNEEEIYLLKKLLNKSNTKQFVLSNPELMFCPIPNCEGFAKKNNNKEYNICTVGHKFCIKCGELWHEDGKCKEEENVIKLFEEFHKKNNLKDCPFCHIVTNKNGGCNHMQCRYCRKHWCWICGEIFDSTEEHYGNINSRCYNKMNANVALLFCSKCENEVNDFFRTFNCGHSICQNCFIDYTSQSCTLLIFLEKIINCAIPGCNGTLMIYTNDFIQFIRGTNNEKLIKKYKFSILFLEYFIEIFSPKNYFKYIELLIDLFDLIADIFYDCYKHKKLYCILSWIGIIFAGISILVYFIIVPIFFHYAIKKLYYRKFIPDIDDKYNNKLINWIIFLGEEILTLVFTFTLFAFNYLYPILFFPILLLILLIRKLIYGTRIC